MCISWEQRPSLSEPECNDPNQEIKVGIILLTSHRLFSGSFNSPIISLLAKENPGSDVTLSCPISWVSIIVEKLFSIFLSFMILSFWARIDLLFCNMNVDLSLSGFFVDSGLCIFGGITPEVILYPFLKNGLFGCAGFLLWHDGSLVATRKLLAVAHGV